MTVELDPPRGHTVEKLVQGAKLLKERGVEIVDINDGSLGRVRMAVLPTALLVREATGLDVSMHFTCRDRNLMSIQGELLAAQALDIRNILAMTGDPPRAGEYGNATAVFDVDAIGLLEIIRRLNEGLDATGSSIGSPTAFCAGAALNPAAADVDREIERTHHKIEAGARWLQTQPVYDLEQLDRFLERCGDLPVPIVVGRAAAPQLAPRRVPAQRGARHHHSGLGASAAARGRRSRAARGHRDGAGPGAVHPRALPGRLSDAVVRAVRGRGRGPRRSR